MATRFEPKLAVPSVFGTNDPRRAALLNILADRNRARYRYADAERAYAVRTARVSNRAAGLLIIEQCRGRF